MSFWKDYEQGEYAQIYDTARAFAEKEIAPHAFEWEEAGIFPAELYQKAGDLGILGVGFPEEVGGVGSGPMGQVMSIQGLMRGQTTGVAVGLFVQASQYRPSSPRVTRTSSRPTSSRRCVVR